MEDESAHELRVMAPRKGDVKIRWDPKDEASTRLARDAFQKAMARGFRAFRTDVRGQREGEMIDTFEPKAKQIVLVPQIVGGVGRRKPPAAPDLASPQDMLCEALHLIDRAGWVQRVEKSSAGYCLTGACREVIKTRPGLTGAERDLLEDVVAFYLSAAIDPDVEPGWDTVIDYNDAPGRTLDEIRGTLSRAGTCQ